MDERQIPPKEAFYSKLTDTDISDRDYQHPHKVFESFKCGTMGIYHNLYMLSKFSVFFFLFFSFSHFRMLSFLFLNNFSVIDFTSISIVDVRIMFCLVDVLILADVFERFRSVRMEQGRF